MVGNAEKTLDPDACFRNTSRAHSPWKRMMFWGRTCVVVLCACSGHFTVWLAVQTSTIVPPVPQRRVAVTSCTWRCGFCGTHAAHARLAVLRHMKVSQLSSLECGSGFTRETMIAQPLMPFAWASCLKRNSYVQSHAYYLGFSIAFKQQKRTHNTS